MHHEFQYILFLCDDRRVVQAFRKKWSTGWLDNTRLTDLNTFTQSELFCNMPSEQSTMNFSIFCFWVMIGGLSKPLGRKDHLVGLDNTRLADLNTLTQSGLFCNMPFVLHIIVKHVWSVAKIAIQVPLNYCWYNPILV